MIGIMKDQSTATLKTAVKANLYAFFQRLCALAGDMDCQGSNGFRWHTSVPHSWFSGNLSLEAPGGDAMRMITESLAYFRSRDVTSFSWWLAPSMEPASWRDHLLARGFAYDDQTPGMAMELSNLPPRNKSPLTIRRVEGEDMLREWVSTFVPGYGLGEAALPSILALFEGLGTGLPIRHYLGYQNDKPVATSTLFLGAGVAGIYDVATLPEARRQGIGSTMTLAPLYEARGMGYQAGILQSSSMGYRVYQKLGFKKVCQVDYFYWQGDGV